MKINLKVNKYLLIMLFFSSSLYAKTVLNNHMVYNLDDKFGKEPIYSQTIIHKYNVGKVISLKSVKNITSVEVFLPDDLKYFYFSIPKTKTIHKNDLIVYTSKKDGVHFKVFGTFSDLKYNNLKHLVVNDKTFSID